MKPKEYLIQLKYLDNEIDCKLKLIEETKAKALSVGSFSTEPRSGGSSRLDFTDWISKLADMEKEINIKIDELVNLQKTINAQIDGVQNSLYRLVLTSHYIRNMTLGEIAAEYNYDYSYIKHVHGYALLEFKKNNPEVFK